MAFRILALLALVLPAPAAELDILAPEHPRAFFFRLSEGYARSGRMPYERWDAEFSRLQGIIGKCLDEEIPGTMQRNPEVFRRFKQAHPEQVVLLHFNGNAKDPRFASERYFPGHWIHRSATVITKDLPPEDGESVIQVENSHDFRIDTGRYKNVNDDVALFGVTADGSHDWSHCEQVQLLAVDHQAGTIRVRRGCYGTKPLAFKAGKARAAAHMVEGPWGKKNHLLWFYNFSEHCPQDANGKTAADLLVDQFAEWFGPGGPLHGLDGVEFDVMHHLTHGDTTGDGVADDGIFDGVNRYGHGMIGFARKLRQRMGDEFIIQGDGALGPGGLRSQRAFQILNGIESEGWPNLNDWDFDDWSGGLNRHQFWQANAHPPAFSYINHKWIEPVPGVPGGQRNPDVPFSRHRLALAAAVCTDAAITFAFTPPRDGQGRLGIWDELVAGTENRKAWLGRAKGAAIHLAARQPDLLAGSGLEARIRGEIRTETRGQDITIRPVPGHEDSTLRFTIPDLPADGPDLVVMLSMSGDTPSAWPQEMARNAKVAVSSGIRSLFPPTPELTGIKLRNKPEQALDKETGASLRYQPRRVIAGRSLPCLAVHPPYKAAKGSVHWCHDLRLDRDLDLRFAIGMGERSPERSDGVVFEVHVAELDGKRPGAFERVFQTTSKAHQWLDQSLPLVRWTGKRVRLKFVADCGPNNNATTDHAAWGAARLVPAGCAESDLTQPRSHMTWLNGDAFTSTFYFRDIRSEKVDLNFEVEAGAPVTIHKLSTHAAPDLVLREFEHGLVLANPSQRPQKFELGKLIPGQSFRRIRGTPKQDPETNDGSKLAASITLGERDAIFLLKDKEGGF